MVEIGVRVLKKEADFESPKKAGGFMLTTLLAMGLALGMMPARAEAQVRGIGPQSWGGGGQVASEMIRQGAFEAGSMFDRTENAKRASIEHDYVASLTRLGEIERNLDYEYAKEKNRLSQDGTKQDIERLEKEYRTANIKIARDRIDLKKGYDKGIRNIKIKDAIIGGVLQGVRGW